MMKSRGWWSVVLVFGAGACGEDAGKPKSETPPTEHPSLTRRDSEAPGAHCPRGGTAFRTGTDANDNGALDDVEVEHIEYVCDVATTLLVRRDTLPPSVDCPTGGVAIQTGIDDNDNGTLEDGEIDQTARTCNAADLWEGDFIDLYWSDPIKVAALRAARVVLGSIEFDGAGAIELPQLELVSGSVHIVPDAPVALPALREVVGDVEIEVGAAACDLPALSSVGGHLRAHVGAVALQLPALRRVGGSLSVGTQTASITFDVLDEVLGDLTVHGNASLLEASVRVIGGRLWAPFTAYGTLSLRGLQTLRGDVKLAGALTGLELDQLASIDGGIQFDSPSVHDFRLALPRLQTIGGDVRAILETGITGIDLPKLTRIGGTFSLIDLPALTRISLPSLTEIAGDLKIHDAEVLASLDVSSLTKLGGGVTLRDAPALSTLSMNRLQQVGELSDLEGESVLVSDTNVDQLAFPSLRSTTAHVGFGGPRLRTVQLPELTTTRSVTFNGPVMDVVAAPKVTELVNLSLVGPIRSMDLGKLTTVTGVVQINDAALTDLEGLSSLADVGLLQLLNCNRLHDLRGLGALTHAASLDIRDNRGLVSLDGLDHVAAVTRVVRLEHNVALTSLAGLRSLTTIGVALSVEDNVALQDVALPSLRTIGGNAAFDGLYIRYNTALSTLSGLDNLMSVRGDIRFLGNDHLSAEEIRAFEERLRD